MPGWQFEHTRDVARRLNGLLHSGKAPPLRHRQADPLPGEPGQLDSCQFHGWRRPVGIGLEI